MNPYEDELQQLFRDKGMQRHEPLRLRANSEDNEPNPLFAVLDKPHNEEEFYTASVDFLNKRLREKCCNPSTVHKTTRSCCDLNAFNRNLENSNRLKLRLGVPNEPEHSLDINKLLPFPKPKSTKDSFLCRLTTTFRKYRRSFHIFNDIEPDDSDASKSYSNFKFPRCERLHKNIDSARLFQITEELTHTSLKDIAGSTTGNSEGDFCTNVKL